MSGRETSESREEKVQRLTEMAESKDMKGLSAELNSMSPQERLKMAQDMDALNATRRADNKSLPDIEITTRRDDNYDTQLDDMQVREEINWWPDKRTDVFDESPLRGNERDMQVFQIPGLDGKTDMDYPLKVTGTRENADGSTTETYKGELDDGVLNDTAMSVEITRDAEGKISSMRVTYDPPMDSVRFGSGGLMGGGSATMRRVGELVYNRQDDGSWTIDGPQQVYPQRFNRILADNRGEYSNVSNEEPVRRAAND